MHLLRLLLQNQSDLRKTYSQWWEECQSSLAPVPLSGCLSQKAEDVKIPVDHELHKRSREGCA